MSRNSNVVINPFENDRRNERPARATRKRRRWPLILFLLLLLACFLPNLLGITGLHQRAVDYALADFQGKVSIERVSLGWLQAVKLTNVSAVDLDGNELLKIEQVTTSQSLLSLLGMKDFGHIEIQKPLIFLHLRPDGSNLEDCAGGLSRAAREPAACAGKWTADDVAQVDRPRDRRPNVGDQFDRPSKVAAG